MIQIPEHLGDVISVLKLLFDIYVFRQKNLPPHQEKQPDPNALGEVILELRKTPEREPLTEAEVSTAIERKFAPEQAKQIETDLSTISLIVNPPNLQEYDFLGFLQAYVDNLQKLARVAELFRIKGFKNADGIALVALPKAEAVLKPILTGAPIQAANMASVAVTKVMVFLSDAAEPLPIILGVWAAFRHYSDGFGQQPCEDIGTLYSIGEAPERNWLAFRCLERNYNFRNFDHRFEATEFLEFVRGVRNGVFSLLTAVEHDRNALAELQAELHQVTGLIRK